MNYITEARRYLSNALDIPSNKIDKNGKAYADRKYVKMAGSTAWNGVLEALDGAFNVRQSIKKFQRPYIKDYQQVMSKRSQTKLRTLNDAYDILHKSMGYDGILNVGSGRRGQEKRMS